MIARDIEVAGGTLRVLSYGTGGSHVIAVHGVTANAACWQAVARALPAGWMLHAVDVRGRGHSAALPGPFGFETHAADLRQVARALGLGRPVLTGHSLGAYIALLAAGSSPGVFGRLVLIDGGLPLPVPPGTDLDALMTATLGPALARLHETYPAEEDYVAFWKAHPALTDWSRDVEDYVRYDLTGQPGALRSRVSEEAVTADSRELLAAGDRIAAALRGLDSPTPLLRAPAGMFGQPPGLLPEELAAYWQDAAPALRVTTIPGTNHYSILMAPHAAATIAARLAARDDA
ncbi:MAG: alpha/beta hydrolase fold protein [Actinomycetia bacterium]|nr:alpha/beta hydrolase fold protein [Actinomycetes bacterium]